METDQKFEDMFDMAFGPDNKYDKEFTLPEGIIDPNNPEFNIATVHLNKTTIKGVLGRALMATGFNKDHTREINYGLTSRDSEVAIFWHELGLPVTDEQRVSSHLGALSRAQETDPSPENLDKFKRILQAINF